MLNTHRVQKSACGIPDARRCYLCPEMISVVAINTLLDRVTSNLARELTVELPQVAVDILRQCFLENCPTQQLRRGIAGQPAELLVDAQHSAAFVNLDYSCAYMLIRGGKSLIARAHPVFRSHVCRFAAATRHTLVETRDRSDELAPSVLNGRNMHDCPDVRAIGPLDPLLKAADRNPGSENFRHRCLFARNRLAVQVEFVRSAIELAVITDTGRPSQQFDRPRR